MGGLCTGALKNATPAIFGKISLDQHTKRRERKGRNIVKLWVRVVIVVTNQKLDVRNAVTKSRNNCFACQKLSKHAQNNGKINVEITTVTMIMKKKMITAKNQKKLEITNKK